MEKKIIDLEIIDSMEESGVDAIALVDQPAIEKNWMYFAKQKFVKPKPGESQSDYMSRCVPAMIDEGKKQDQAVAMCISMYQNMTADFSYDAFAEFADYPWDDCIADQLDKGLSEESANNICGWIRWQNMSVKFADYPWEDCMDDMAARGYDEEASKNLCGWIRAQNMSKIKFAKISIDYDDTLSTPEGLAYAKKLVEAGNDLHVVSARNEVSDEMKAKAAEAGIPANQVHAVGSNSAKVDTVKKMKVSKHIDNNAEVVKALGTIGEKFEIDTSGLPTYTQETGKKKANYSAILAKAKELGFSATDKDLEGLEFHKEIEGEKMEFAAGYTVYKYEGGVSSETRDFCREMVNIDRFYTFDEIKQLSATDPNPGFGLGGSDNYDLWLYKGGPNCKHHWQKYWVTPAGKIEAPTSAFLPTTQDVAPGMVTNKGRASGLAGENPYSMPNHGYAFSLQEDKKELVGPVAIPDIEIPRKDDKTGETYFVRFSPSVVKRMAEKFLTDKRTDATNIQHVDTMPGGTNIVESWVVENPEDKANTVYGLSVPVGTWMVRCKVMNDQTWAKVKSGEVQGFSLQGSFITKQEYEQYQKDKKMWDELIKLVGSFE